jgi:hypothetical protein
MTDNVEPVHAAIANGKARKETAQSSGAKDLVQSSTSKDVVQSSPSKENGKENPPKPTSPGQETIFVFGASAGANLSAGSNFFIGRNAGRGVSSGTCNIIIGDDALGTNESQQFVISETLPRVEDYQLVSFISLVPNARTKLLLHFSKHGDDRLRQALSRLEELAETCLVRLRILEHRINEAADVAYLKSRFPTA